MCGPTDESVNLFVAEPADCAFDMFVVLIN